LLPFRRPQLAL